MRPRERRWRWRCWRCAAFGYGPTDSEAMDGFEKHYADKHLQEGPG